MQNAPEAASSRRTNTFLPRNCKLDGLESTRWNATLKPPQRAPTLRPLLVDYKSCPSVSLWRLLRNRNDKSWPSFIRLVRSAKLPKRRDYVQGCCFIFYFQQCAGKLYTALSIGEQGRYPSILWTLREEVSFLILEFSLSGTYL